MKKQFKKNILSLTMIAVVSIFSGYTIHRNHQNRPELSDIMKANIEALSEGEVIIGIPCIDIRYSQCLYFYPWEDFEIDGVPYT